MISRAMPTSRRFRKRSSLVSAGSAPIESAPSTSSRILPDSTTAEARRWRPSARGRAPLELILDRRRIEAAGGQEHVRVEPESRDLGDEPLVALPRAGERRLDALLADLPRSGRGALGDEPADVGARWSRRRALDDSTPEPGREARGRAHVTRRSRRAHTEKESVAVAVVAQLLDRERIPRRLALPPEPLARAAVEVRL